MSWVKKGTRVLLGDHSGDITGDPGRRIAVCVRGDNDRYCRIRSHCSYDRGSFGPRSGSSTAVGRVDCQYIRIIPQKPTLSGVWQGI